MSVVNSEIEELNHKTERTKAALSVLHARLGQMAFKYHEVIGYQPSQEFFDRLVEALRESEDIARQKKLADSGIETDNKQKLYSAFGFDKFSRLKKIRDLEILAERIEQRIKNLYADYGACLAEGADSWLDPQAPDDLVEICGRIRDERIRLEKLNMNAEYLFTDKEIESHYAQCNVFEKQIANLQAQQRLIQSQISGIEEKLSAERKTIEALQNRQQQLTARAKFLEEC
ncbi:MAG: hypothetical protein MJ052_02600 [Sphaerochaetaceae bacterium]|nr:hypothetical protein [Sphaerochaetaceae bacterium]